MAPHHKSHVSAFELVKDDVDLVSLVHKWRDVPMKGSGREDLVGSDIFWQTVYCRYACLRYPKGELLFRFHQGGGDEPQFGDYPDWEDYGAPTQEALFNEFHRKWKDEQDPSKIRFDNHWVSFTKNPEPFLKHYYSEKGLRGLVIVLRANKSVDISSFPAWGNVQDEQEVVAPLDETQVVEILPFNEFKEKYCKAKN